MEAMIPALLLIFLGVVIYTSIQSSKRKKGEPMGKEMVVCTVCETVGQTVKHTKGSFLIEVILWLCFIIPGLIYSIWRLTTKADICQSCGSASVVPLNSPAGKRILKDDVK